MPGSFIIPGLLTLEGEVVTTQSVSTLTGTYDFSGATVTMPAKFVVTTGSYANPSWITTLAASKLIGNLVYPGGSTLLADPTALHYPSGGMLASQTGQLYYGSGDAMTDQSEQVLFATGDVALGNDGKVHGDGSLLTNLTAANITDKNGTGSLLTTQSDPVLISGPIEYWNAFDITGLANGASLTSWTGRKGTVANLTSAQAEFVGYTAAVYASGGLCGRPAMHCTGSSVLASTTNIAAGSYSNLTVMHVFWAKTLPTNGAGEFSLGIGSGGSNRVTQQIALTGSELTIFHQGSGVDFGTKHRLTTGPLAHSQQPVVAFYTFDGSIGRSSLWINGIETDSNSGGSPSLTINGKVVIGNLSPGDGVIFDVGAVAFWNTTLAPGKIRELSNYMYDLFIHDGRPRCFVLGDSIGEGTNQDVNNTIVDQLQRALPQVRFVNAARGGHSMADQVSGVAPYDNLINSIRPNEAALMFAGSIDIASNGDSVATVETNHTTNVTNLKVQGAFVVQCTMIPKQANTDVISQATSDSHRATYNTWISTPSNSGADGVVDLAAISGFDTNTSWQSTTNYYTIVNSITGTNATGGTQIISLPNFASRLTRVASVIKVSDSSDVSSNFESIISVAGQIKQTSGNLSGIALTVTINDGAHPTSTATANWVTPILAVLKPYFTT